MMLSSKLESGIRVATLGLLASGLVAVPAVAATASNSLSVSVTVQATCTVTASTLSFGNYTGSATTATSAVSVTCTNATPYNVGLSAGTASGRDREHAEDDRPCFGAAELFAVLRSVAYAQLGPDRWERYRDRNR